MKLILSFGALACLAFSQYIPNPSYAPMTALLSEPILSTK